jgi:hypothetical protein
MLAAIRRDHCPDKFVIVRGKGTQDDKIIILEIDVRMFFVIVFRPTVDKELLHHILPFGFLYLLQRLPYLMQRYRCYFILPFPFRTHRRAVHPKREHRCDEFFIRKRYKLLRHRTPVRFHGGLQDIRSIHSRM